ncbi:MAG: FAD-dependent oxidoreductase [Alphaproteobacteria bacterium]|nr:FAD-dependent oxidoreductase [Alphaproteobacteria bacterium]
MNGPKVAVIGAGIVGVFCALRLSERGARVTLWDRLERGALTRAANGSLSAAGMLAPFVETTNLPSPDADFAELALTSFHLWRTRAERSALRDVSRFDGGYFLARDGAEQGAMLGLAQALEHACRPVRHAWSDAALYCADEGALDPVASYTALLGAALDAGVATRFGEDACAVDLDADRVVFAPGGAIDPALFARAAALKHVQPAKGQIACVAAPDAPDRTVHAPGLYLTPQPSGALLLGATMEIGNADQTLDRNRLTDMFVSANPVFGGQLRLLDGGWAGVRAMSPDWMPLVGPSGADGALVACGHSRNGWLLAPITAEMICAHVFEEDLPPLWRAFRPDRFETGKDTP